ncbi:MAG: DUF4124 domain-containing protein [Pseudomonadota bacterium]
MILTIVFSAGSLLAAAAFSSVAMAQGIYTCVDSKGRKITSDRPIAECMDRAQQEISPSGTVRRTIAPSLTAAERVAAEEKEKVAAEARLQAIEEKKRDRAVLQRYPNKQSHDKERGVALAQIDETIKAAAKRGQELIDQRKSINAEMEFYKKDPTRAPASLRRRVDENESSVLAQKRVIADQESERQRVSRRFDDELAKLRPVWAAMGTGSETAATGGTGKN